MGLRAVFFLLMRLAPLLKLLRELRFDIRFRFIVFPPGGFWVLLSGYRVLVILSPWLVENKGGTNQVVFMRGFHPLDLGRLGREEWGFRPSHLAVAPQ